MVSGGHGCISVGLPVLCGKGHFGVRGTSTLRAGLSWVPLKGMVPGRRWLEQRGAERAAQLPARLFMEDRATQDPVPACAEPVDRASKH